MRGPLFSPLRFSLIFSSFLFLLERDLAEDFDGSDRTYISESEDYQYVRVNVAKLSSHRGSAVLTESILHQLTNQVLFFFFFFLSSFFSMSLFKFV